ncbi:MAG: hypothetical protein M0R39_17425, partial [Prolixibacteraceae bacterium]|nr:hypothetical protein [Prolixibacteraceae bacterium]
PLIFESYNYKWGKIKTSSIGDASLPFGAPISDLAPSTLIRTDGSPIYIMDYDGTVLKKRHVSYEAFMAFGYRWEDVKYLSSHGMPGLTHPSVLYKDKHPSGSLVVIPGIPKVYLINKGQLHHIVSPLAFESNNYDWSKIKTATSQDALLPIGDSVDTRQGTMVLSNGIFFIDYDVSGILKRPVGPWECYADRFHYNSSDWFNVADPSWLPTRTGSLLTC